MIPERFGACRVIEEIGHGPLTVVYRAVQEPLGRTVAVKALRSTITPASPLAAQLEREAHLLAELSHEGILALYDFVRTDEAMWMVLEHVEGVSLATLLEKAHGGIGLSAALSIALEVAGALAHAHARGVVHRDVKPANILLSQSGRVKLCDFGIAHDDRLPSTPEPIEGTGGFGTPAYMSPEQVLGEPVDARTDLFSLGIVLFQMLAGVRPFDAPDARAVTQRIRHDAPTRLIDVAPSTPPALERVALQCLEKKPDDRMSSADELIAELSRVATELGVATSAAEITRVLAAHGFATIEEERGSDAHAHANANAPRARAADRPRGIGRAAFGQLFVLFAMILGAGAIQANAQAGDSAADTRGEALELLPEKGGALRVVARPWASVYVDGQLVDVTPFARPIPLRAGEHDVSFRHPIAPDEKRTVRIQKGETAFVEVEMKVPEPPAPPPPSATAAPTSSTP